MHLFWCYKFDKICSLFCFYLANILSQICIFNKSMFKYIYIYIFSTYRNGNGWGTKRRKLNYLKTIDTNNIDVTQRREDLVKSHLDPNKYILSLYWFTLVLLGYYYEFFHWDIILYYLQCNYKSSNIIII